MGDVRELFPKKVVQAAVSNREPQEIITDFHNKLEEVLDEFNTLSVRDKYEVAESLTVMNKDLFKLYMDLRKRHEFHLNN